MKFEEGLTEYLKFIKLKRKEITYLTIENRIKKYVSPFFKEKTIEEISKKDILEWQIYIENFNFKYNYKSSIYYALSGFYNYLESFYNTDNIVRKIGNFKNNEIEEIGNIWTIEEFNKFINVIENNEHKLLFNILYFTGIRKGELLGLKWNDIDFINNKININKSMNREHKINTPKTKSSNRTIMIDNLLVEEFKKIKKDSKESDLIFNISFSSLKRIKDNYCELENVKKIKIHEFRHSHACLLFLNNVPIDEISYRLGHSKLSITTDTYLKYLPKNEKRVISTLNSIRLN